MQTIHTYIHSLESHMDPHIQDIPQGIHADMLRETYIKHSSP